MDRRALFFLAAAVVCAVLIPVTESEQQWVPIALSIAYTLLALASWADARVRGRIDPRPPAPSSVDVDRPPSHK